MKTYLDGVASSPAWVYLSQQASVAWPHQACVWTSVVCSKARPQTSQSMSCGWQELAQTSWEQSGACLHSLPCSCLNSPTKLCLAMSTSRSIPTQTTLMCIKLIWKPLCLCSLSHYVPGVELHRQRFIWTHTESERQGQTKNICCQSESFTWSDVLKLCIFQFISTVLCCLTNACFVNRWYLNRRFWDLGSWNSRKKKL